MDIEQILTIVAPPLGAGVEGASLYLALLAIGLVVGALTGFFGVGGGFLVVPLLNVVLGIGYELAVGSSLSFIIGTSFAGVLKQREAGNVDFRIAGVLASGSVFGALAGDSLQNLLLFGLAGGSEAIFTPLMHSIFIALLIATIFGMRSREEQETAKGVQRLPLLVKYGPAPRFSTPETAESFGGPGYSVPLTFLAGMVVGIATGLLGIGGGVLLVPVLLGLFGLAHQRAAGTSLAVIFVTAVVGIAKKGMAEIPKVSLPLTVVLLLSSVIGVQLGVFALKKTGSRDFRRYFVYVLVLTIVMIGADLGANFISF
ncbi:MAG: sulfite exporter TauE/SafE family protein [Spirochaetaceae bacterium]